MLRIFTTKELVFACISAAALFFLINTTEAQDSIGPSGGGGSGSATTPVPDTFTPSQTFTYNDPVLSGGQNGNRPSIPFVAPFTGDYEVTFSVGTAFTNAGFDISTAPITTAGTGDIFVTSTLAERVTTAAPTIDHAIGVLTAGTTYYYTPFGGGNNSAADVTIVVRALLKDAPVADIVKHTVIGTFTEELSTCPSNTQEVDGSLLVNGVGLYPIVASKNPDWVVGNDLQLPDWQGLFVRNNGGDSEAPGVTQADATAANGLTGTVVGPANQVSTNVNSGSGNTIRFLQTRTVTITSSDTETRPINVALLKCVILSL